MSIEVDLLQWFTQPVLWVIAIVALVVRRSLYFVRPEQRLIVERLGRYHRMGRPGVRMRVPFLERAVAVSPDQFLPGWQAYSEEQLEKNLVAAFYSRGAPGLAGAAGQLQGDDTAEELARRAALLRAQEAARTALQSKRQPPGGTDGS